jgi:hypothetical protein
MSELMENWIMQVIDASFMVYKVNTDNGLPVLDTSEFFTKKAAILKIIDGINGQTHEFSAFMTRDEYKKYYCGANIPQKMGTRPDCLWPEAMCPGYCGGECCAMSSLMVRKMHN